jgi:hypothetical protein
MKDYSGKYKYYTHTDAYGRTVVIAVSTYEGKTVKGYAKCDVNDVFNLEEGKKLAAARCNERVARKRAKRSERKLVEAKARLAEAQAYFTKMTSYFEDSQEALVEAKASVESVLNTL